MKRLTLLGLVCSLAMPAFAQAPPQTEAPVRPPEQNSAEPCANAMVGQGNDTDTKKQPAQGKTLSDKLAASSGIICPPSVDPAMKQPTPPGGSMRIIPPPDSPGGDPNMRPK